jgi:threonine dehydrogenase-like Zn-dependent dehydrogenase
MRAAQLYGVGDLRLVRVPRPSPGPGEILVRVEACGICPTDVRKFMVGLNDGEYPINLGHEWVGHIAEVGPGVTDWHVGERVFGDTYAGYCEWAVLATTPAEWSYGPLRIGDLPLHRAVFIEPLADCLHAVHDQAAVTETDRLLVVGSGQMGLQIVAVAADAGIAVAVSDPLPERRERALDMGADLAVHPDQLTDAAQAWSPGGVTAIILTLGRQEMVSRCLPLASSGGRLVLFAGFGQGGIASLDVNMVHYRELAIIGSEWVGTPPRQRRARYDQALALLRQGGRFALESLVSAVCSLDTLADAFAGVHEQRELKYVLEMETDR